MATFTENDIRLLDKTIMLRESLVDFLTTKEKPTKARDIECFTNLLESIDRSIFSKAKIKIDDTATRANEETRNMLRTLLVDLHTDTSLGKDTRVRQSPVPEFESRNISVNDGELIKKLDMAEDKISV